MNTPTLPDSTQLSAIAAAYRLRLIVLFGSAARGMMHTESDLDLGVLPQKKLSDAKRISLWSELSRLFNREVDLTILSHSDPVLGFEIAKEGILLYEAETDMWENWKSYRVRQYWDTEKFRRDLSNFISRRAEEMRYALVE